MPELRKDPVIDRWVLISTDRNRRPSDFVATIAEQNRSFSPFSPGNEAMTPPEILSLPKGRSLDQPWTLRVVPNKYPAIKNETSLKETKNGLNQMLQGAGSHEVIIETPHMDLQTSEMKPKDLENLIRTYCMRIKSHRRNENLKYVQIFKNQGPTAGATLRHAHSQLLALPRVPMNVKNELRGAKRYFKKYKCCIYCEIIKQEKSADVRIIYENSMFIAIAPYASRFSHESWILPKHHESHFEKMNRRQQKAAAAALKDVLLRIDYVLQKPDLNYVLHTAPLQSKKLKHYHWHIEIIPRVTRIAGFELGSGIHINPTSPEDAAAQLKKIII
ncbi:MAG: galactose-1-phosphate uridylyltransferase [Calditrichia bacterium]